MYFTRSGFFFTFCETFRKSLCIFLQDSKKKYLNPSYFATVADFEEEGGARWGWNWINKRRKLPKESQKKLDSKNFPRIREGVLAVYHTFDSGNRGVCVCPGVEFLQFRTLSLICPNRHFFKKRRKKTGSKQIDLVGNKATCDIWPKIKQEGAVCVAIVHFFALPFRV